MSLRVIGLGVGRTGTYSLKLAINELGMGPCHHMEEVIQNMPVQLPLWEAAVNGSADFPSIYQGYGSAVDWPTAGFMKELYVAYPDAKFVLTHRDPERWADSIESTIFTLLAGRSEAPPEMRDWLEMVSKVVAKTGFPDGASRDALIAGFKSHIETAKSLIPGDQLLLFEVKQGWGPLCEFLDVARPDGEFPRTNDRAEFWDKVSGG